MTNAANLKLEDLKKLSDEHLKQVAGGNRSWHRTLNPSNRIDSPALKNQH